MYMNDRCINIRFEYFIILIIFIVWFYESCKFIISSLTCDYKNHIMWCIRERFTCLFVVNHIIYCSAYEISVDKPNGGSLLCLIIW